MQLPSFIN